MVIAVFALALVVAQTCQQAQVRVDEEQAIAIAEREVDFSPGETQVRFLRQGIGREPFWFVSLAVPLGDGRDEGFSKLAVVKINANTGKVESVQQDQLEGARSGPGRTDATER